VLIIKYFGVAKHDLIESDIESTPSLALKNFIFVLNYNTEEIKLLDKQLETALSVLTIPVPIESKNKITVNGVDFAKQSNNSWSKPQPLYI